MNPRTVVLTIATCVVGLTLCFAQTANMGTWKLDEANSKLQVGMQRITTVIFEPAGDNMKVTVDGVDADGKPMHNEWIGKFDGNDYPVTGDSMGDTRAYKQLDDGSLELTVKKAGNVIATGRIILSADGKRRTVSVTGTDPTGKKFETSAVYDKQ